MALNLGVFVLILLGTGRAVEFLINKYMLNENTDGVKELTNASPNQPRDVFKTENEVDDELIGA